MQCEVLRALRLPGIMVTSLPHHVPPAPRPSRTTSLPHHTPLQRRAAASEGWADSGKPGGAAGGRVLVTSPSLHTGHVPREAMCHVPREVICHVPRDGELTAAGGVQVGDGRVGGVSATVSQRAGALRGARARHAPRGLATRARLRRGEEGARRAAVTRTQDVRRRDSDTGRGPSGVAAVGGADALVSGVRRLTHAGPQMR